MKHSYLKEINTLKSLKDITEARRYVLETVSKAYNSENRAVNPDTGACSYAPTKDSPGCAVGRFLCRSSKVLNKSNRDKNLSFLWHDSKLIPNYIRRLGFDFLSDIQGLHDCESNWDSDGLSEQGNKIVNIIKKKNLNCNIQKYA